MIINTLGLSSLILSQHQMGKFFMTARSGTDSGNDDKEEDGVWGWSPSGVHGQRIVMKSQVPTVEYFSLTVNFACIFVHKRYKYAEKSVGLLHLQTPVDVHATVLRTHSLPCYLSLTHSQVCVFSLQQHLL